MADERRLFDVASGYARKLSMEVFEWLVENNYIVFYQTIIFPDGDYVYYYVGAHDNRVKDAPRPIEDRRKE